MATLQVPSGDVSSTKRKAMEDAKLMQASIEDDCRKAGHDLPPYALSELIGKGSFGRVYKATSRKPDTPRLVAVKIIDIEESDSLDPTTANTYSEIMREINTLKVLRNSGAKNINYIVDAIPVGQSMWMVTEYCAGGSVATLMRPTGGLQEKWIIPILREVAEALFWVHQGGIIHRDIKCANILITENGQVQLCDFGVAGLIETKFDKRSTFTGTLHWMAPEFFDPARSYDTKVDIWAFGSLVYEIASGLPPNVAAGTMDVSKFGNYLKQHIPRLEGGNYSPQLRDLVTFCMVEDPDERPTIEQVQRHPYIFNTNFSYPTVSLSRLVSAYKVWEAQGGIRKSLFSPGGAQGLSGYTPTAASEEWNFSSTDNFEQLPLEDSDVEAVYDVYGSNVDFPHSQTPRASKPKGRRRPPPQILALKAPLEKLFDPNTISNYDENSRSYYLRPEAPKTSDLPLRDDSLHATLRESLIDLDASLHGSDLSRFADADTIRAGDANASTARQNGDDTSQADLSKPPLSDPADMKNNRRTQDWTFPSMAPASANPEMSHFPFNTDEQQQQRPPLHHYQTEPLGGGVSANPQLKPLPIPASLNRISAGSLIDLDESLPPDSASTLTDLSRPSTSHSDVASLSGSEAPFEFESHPSVYAPFGSGLTGSSNREPSIYVSDDSEYTRWADFDRRADDRMQEPPLPPLPGGGGEGGGGGFAAASDYAIHGQVDGDGVARWSGTTAMDGRESRARDDIGAAYRDHRQALPRSAMPSVPRPPAEAVMLGLGSPGDLKDELSRMLASLQDHLGHSISVLEALPVRRVEPRGGGGVFADTGRG